MTNPPPKSAEPKPNAEEADDLAPEYRFRYVLARPNHFAVPLGSQLKAGKPPGSTANRCVSVGYGAVERFGPADGEVWTNYITCFGASHLKEVVSLDGLLCPNLLKELSEEDWEHNLADDNLIFYFRELDYFLSRFDVPQNYHIIAVAKNPNGSEALPDPRFEFIGYDLTEENTVSGISALTNCGGWENIFQNSDLSEYGLVTSYEKATQINQGLRANYPDDAHAFCDLYAVWRMTNR